MKKMQNYLNKPDELRKKLENPSFRHDFMQWSRSHLCQGVNRQHSKSKSPHERSRSHLGYSSNKNNNSISHNNSQINHHNPHNHSKQNIVPNYSISTSYLNTKNNAKKNVKNTENRSVNKKERQENSENRSHLKSRTKPMPSQSKSHSFLQAYPYRSNDDSHVRTHSMKKSELIENKYRSERPQSQPHSNNNSSSAYVTSSRLKKHTQNNSSHKSLQKQQIKKKFEKNVTEFKYSYRTRQGVLATNPNKTNQDRLLIKTHMNGKNVFSVADGHGTYGHLVAQSLVSNLSIMLEQQFAETMNNKISGKQPEAVLPNLYNKLQNILQQTSQINASCSGSTLVTVVLEDRFITCANVGDSRAILARQVDKKSWEMIYLSQDQKPSIQSQRKRILKQGGRIHSLRDQRGEQVGPLRVWLPNQNIQGLAMSRSMGDNVSKPFGVTHKPQIIKIPTDKRDKFILIASDGVWQFITNQQVLQLIVPYYREKKLEQACDALMKLAYQRWTVQDTTVVDDITLILIFLQN